MDFSYYPGCSLESTACEYNDSVRAVFRALDVGLQELEDWNCCGASSAHNVDRLLSIALPARNLAIAQERGRDIVMPCAACYNRHKTADYEMRAHPERRKAVENAVGFQFTGQIAVRPLLDVIGNEIGIQRVKDRVQRPLKGLRAVGYYGCLLVRPPEITQFENPENPVLLNEILAALGADVRPWSYATDCCGGGLALTKSEVAARLVQRLVARAREAGAQAIVTSCPLCQLNLEMRQESSSPEMPILYFTELLGLALGLDEARSWWGKHLVDPTGLLVSVDLQ
jgi:heterodisulfide reductase subunit B